MRSKLEHILEGDFTTEERALDFSCTKVEISISPQEPCEGSFHVLSRPGTATTGFVTSSDMRMELMQTRLSGSDTEIGYRFHSELCLEGDVIKGSFHIISNLGEYYIPFVVTVEHPYVDSSIGQIRNLFHFANLAKSNWKEAVTLFYSPDFERVLTGNDEQYLEAYHALSAIPENERNLEEFLLHINKKQPLEYLTRTPELSFTFSPSTAGLQEKEIEILRNGWGYTHLEIETCGEFLFTERTVLNDDDFLGNICYLRLFFDISHMGSGRHYGKVILKGGSIRLEIPVEIHLGSTVPGKSTQRTKKEIACRISELYLQMRLKQLSTKQWMSRTGKLVEQLADMDGKDIMARLYQAQLLITDSRSNEAGWLLDQSADLLEEAQRDRLYPEKELDFIFCYHSYLTTLVRTEEEYALSEAARVERVYRRGDYDWRVGWLMLYLPTEVSRSLPRRWALLEELYYNGCTSPILYMEGLLALNQNPLIVRKVSGFASQVLLFGARRHALAQESMEQVLFLFEKERTYQPLLLRAMTLLYKDYGDKRLLQEICEQLIKGRRSDAEALEWYRLGVDAQMKLPNLYEMYMASIDLTGMREIPRPVLLYFSYANQLDAEHTAYYYHYLIRNRREVPEILDSVRENMAAFALDQIRKGRIDRHLAAIYDEVLQPSHLERGIAQSLADLIYSGWLTTDHTGIRKAYVYQKGFTKPWEYDIRDGKGWVSVYGNDYLITLEDEYGNRYLRSVDYTLEKLMLAGRFQRPIAEQVWDNPRLNYLICLGEHGDVEAHKDNISRFQFLAEYDALSPALRRTLAFKALDYYREAGEDKQVQIALRKLDTAGMNAVEKNRYFTFLCFREDLTEAMDYLADNTPYFAEPALLKRVLDQVLSQEREMSPVHQRVLYFGSVRLLNRGKADTPTILYLMEHYQGLSKELRDIWRTAGNMNLPRAALEGRLLTQLLFTGAFVGEQDEIFRSYAENDGDERVVLAYLLQSTRDYFVNDRVVSNFLFEQLEKRFLEGAELPEVSALALLKYYTENPSVLTDESRKLALHLLDREMNHRVHMGYFKTFLDDGLFPPGKMRDRLELILDELSDKMVVEYHARPGCAARIHYVIAGNGREDYEYEEEYMQEVCDGVCFKEFVIFFGESLQYYITEEYRAKLPDGSVTEESELTQSGDLQRSDITGEVREGRFDAINDMLISLTLQDYGTFDQMLGEYRRKEYLNGELFRLL
ncbi:MAG: DUF5717 family protein [Lachnospiraceae bacterium]|nr:DUF5717 family protein [Lachnospiraceae bacterium]